MGKKVLVFVGEGLGNIIQAIPTLIAINKLGYIVDVALRANYPGIQNILNIPEINKIFNVYIEAIPEGKSYDKIILTMFGHVESYKKWEEDFEGVEVIQDSEIAIDLGKMNDVEVNFRFARHLGYEDKIPEIKINYPDNSTYQYFDNIICPGSGGENKRWPYFMDLAKRLKGRVGIVGGPNEEKVAWPPNCVDLTGAISLEEIAAIVSKAGVYIGNDSGITHLANATKTPCVVVWGPTNLTKCRPWNSPTAIVLKQYGCQPCLLLQGETKCEKEQKPISCLVDLSVEEVLDAVKQVKNFISYKNEEDYKNYWNGYKKQEYDEYSGIIISQLKDLMENNSIEGETCIDYGCGDGKYIPVLNHFYKNIKGIDFVEYDIPKLNGVTFNKAEEVNESCDLLFLSNILSYAVQDDNINIKEKVYNNIKGKFNRIIIIDMFNDKNNSSSKKRVPLDLVKLQEDLGFKVEEARDVQVNEVEFIKIVYGQKV
jgi:hypothetical protein